MSGLRARGGFEVDLVWANGVVFFRQDPVAGPLVPLKVRLGDRVVELPTRRGESYRFGPNLSPVR